MYGSGEADRVTFLVQGSAERPSKLASRGADDRISAFWIGEARAERAKVANMSVDRMSSDVNYCCRDVVWFLLLLLLQLVHSTEIN